MKKRPVPWYFWPWWMTLLAVALFVFYVLFTPFWMGVRFASWLADRFGGGGSEPVPAARPNRKASSSE